ncbi:MAG TPA: GDSL-type esterase/lipase family protein [Chthoniobacterales bacterium]|jgi:lysophospholipase L1-like esterase/pimeloyl-ACP methyl ester carboxylesterase
MILHPASAAPEIRDAKRIVFIGDSITYAGDYVIDVEAWLSSIGAPAEVLNVGLPSETAADLTLSEQEETHIRPYGFPRPTVSERLQRVLEKTRPDWVFACFGMNDGSSLPQNDEGFARYCAAMDTLKAAVDSAGVQRLIILTPPIHDAGPGQPQSAHDGMLTRFSDWLLSKRREGWEIIDLHGPMRADLEQRRQTTPDYRFAQDGVHPNRDGRRLMAKQIIAHFSSPDAAEELFQRSPFFGPVFRKLVAERMTLLRDAWLTETQHTRPGLAAGLPLDQATAKAREITTLMHEQSTQPFPGSKSLWHGFDRYDFPLGDTRICSVIVPATPLPGKLWAWKGEFLDAFADPEVALLKRGVHIVYLSIPHLFGAPEAVGYWNEAYAELTQRCGLAKRPALIGLSRGGLYCYNWAIANPGNVACIYGDAPVMDIKSWPAGHGKGTGSPKDWQLALQVHGFKSEAEALAYPGNPIDNLRPLADAGIPLLHVYGDADDVVPWDENTGLAAERYRAMGGSIELIPKPGVGHHPHGLPDPTPVVEWILENLKATNHQP